MKDFFFAVFLFLGASSIQFGQAALPTASCGTPGTNCPVQQTCIAEGPSNQRCTSSNCHCSCTSTVVVDGIPEFWAMERSCGNV